jgi:alpha-1,2-mannosyltransferase
VSDQPLESRRHSRDWRAPAALFLVLFALFGLTARTGGGSWDYYAANYASWHLVHDGDPWLDGEAHGGTIPGLQGDPEESTWVIHDAPNGHTVVKRFPGVIAISLPAYYVAHLAHLDDAMTVVPGGLTAALACALGIMLLFLAMRTLVPPVLAGVSCALVALGTPVWTVAADAVWPHTVSVLGLGGMAWAASRGRWWLAGAFGGVILWGRLHAALVVAGFGVLLGWWRRSPRIVAEVGVVSAAFLAGVCAWTRWWTGSWDPLSSYGSGTFEHANKGWQHLTSMVTQLVSPDRGILVWTPLLLLLLPALVRGWREVPDWARALLFGALAYQLAQAWIADPLGGDSYYGYRHGIELVVAATPALAVTSHRVGPVARKLLVPVITVQVTAMAFGSLTGMFIPKEQAWHDNTFLHDMRASWPLGPLVLVPVACLVILAALRVAPLLAAQRLQLPMEAGAAGATISSTARVS